MSGWSQAPNTVAAASRIGIAAVLTKLLRRAWSTRQSVALVHEPLVEAPMPVGFRAELVPPESFEELAQILAGATGLDYLFVRNAEHTRRAGIGTVCVARTDTGLAMAFLFVYETNDRAALNHIAPNMHPPLAADEALTEQVYCLPAHRGHGVMTKLLQVTESVLAARGKRRAFAYVDTTNTQSLRTFARAGYAPAGFERVDRYRFGRHSTTFRTTTGTSYDRWRAAAAGSQKRSRPATTLKPDEASASAY